MRTAILVVIFLLLFAGCERRQDEPRPTPAPGEVSVPQEWEDRMTAHVVRLPVAGETTRPDQPTSSASLWAIRISGRTFPYDDAGLSSLGAALLRLADTNRRAKPPQVSQIHLVIRADPDAPYDVTRSLLERAARAGFYKFSFHEPLPSAPADSRQVTRSLVPDPDERDPRPNPPLPRTVFIKLVEAKQQFDHGAQFFDARVKAAFDAGHVKGAVILDPTDAAIVAARTVPEAVLDFDRSAPVVVYDDGGDYDGAQLVALQMRKFGFSNVTIFEEGFGTWKAKGYPVEPTR